MTAQTPHSNHNYTPNQKVGIETGTLAAAEIVSMGVSLGVVGVADQVMPGALKACSKALGKAVFEPYLDYLESGLSKICKLEECQVDKTKSREERAENLAKTSVVFGAAWVASIAAKLATRGSLNRALGLLEEEAVKRRWWEIWKTSTHEKIILGMDEGVHYGSLLLMNTVGAKQTDDLIRGTEGMLVSLGFPKQKAHELAAMSIVWELPNFLGLVSGVAGITGIHKYDWDKKLDGLFKKKPATHVEKLLAQKDSNELHLKV